MKNKILFGALFAVFLMLMLPVNSAVESDVVENNQIINKKDIDEKRINYKDGWPPQELCDALYNLTILCVVLFFMILPLFLAMFIATIAIIIGCEWDTPYPPDGCNSCMLYELLETKLL